MVPAWGWDGGFAGASGGGTKQSPTWGGGSGVTCVGDVPDTAPAYAREDVFVLSSRTGQMPIALLEAMASGCAVVSTDVGDVRAILPEEQQRWVVPAGQPEALAAALRGVLADADLRRRLGAVNRRRVEEVYEARTCLERFAALYGETAGVAVGQ